MVESVNKKTRLDGLFERFRKLSPKERNEELQALYTAILSERCQDGAVSPADMELIRALQKSFGISIRYEEINKDGGVKY